MAQDSSNLVQQLQQIVGSDFSTDHLKQILAQIKALGIKVQNEQRGDLRPRFLLPTGETWDFGPGGWVNRGNIGDWDAAGGGGGGGGGGLFGGHGQDMSQNPEDTPGFGFRMKQGIRAIESDQFAKGTGLTGGAAKRLAMFGTGLGDQLYQDQFQDFLNQTKLGMPPPPA